MNTFTDLALEALLTAGTYALGYAIGRYTRHRLKPEEHNAARQYRGADGHE